MNFRPLTTNERAETPGFTHVAIVTADDLTTTTANTVQTITLCTLQAGDQVQRVKWYLKTAFQDTASAGNDATTASVGDSAAVTTFLAAGETNLNGTELIWRTFNTTTAYTAGDFLTVSFTPKTATAVSVLNRGELLLFFSIFRPTFVAQAISATAISKT
jgi:hypothetical protein